jgi:hypothetical protein
VVCQQHLKDCGRADRIDSHLILGIKNSPKDRKCKADIDILEKAISLGEKMPNSKSLILQGIEG